jgi:hypothetical protein
VQRSQPEIFWATTARRACAPRQGAERDDSRDDKAGDDERDARLAHCDRRSIEAAAAITRHFAAQCGRRSAEPSTSRSAASMTAGLQQLILDDAQHLRVGIGHPDGVIVRVDRRAAFVKGRTG